MAFASFPLAPTSAYLPSPRSLCLPRPQLPSPLSSRRFKETGVAAPLEFSSAAWPRWRTGISFFPSFIKKKARSREEIKEELLAEIACVDRGAEATDEDKQRIDQIARELEAVNAIKEPCKSDLLNGKWELIYTTSSSTLKVQRPKFLRPIGKIYQAINVDTLRAQNMETWPYFNQIPIKAPGRNRGELEITYLDEEIRISRGYKGNLFILKMVDRSYRVPL